MELGHGSFEKIKNEKLGKWEIVETLEIGDWRQETGDWRLETGDLEKLALGNRESGAFDRDGEVGKGDRTRKKEGEREREMMWGQGKRQMEYYNSRPDLLLLH